MPSEGRPEKNWSTGMSPAKVLGVCGSLDESGESEKIVSYGGGKWTSVWSEKTGEFGYELLLKFWIGILPAGAPYCTPNAVNAR